MTNSKTTKRALFSSVVALLLCFTMLLGTTFAWFTDQVSSSGNKIQAGTLKIDLELLENGTYTSVRDMTDPIFNYDLWEPGYTEVKTLKIVNEGNLALKYQLNVVAENADCILANVIDVYMCFGESTATSAADLSDTSKWWKCGTLAEMMANPEGFTQGKLLPTGATYDGELLGQNGVAIGEITASIALHMQETAGNEYQGLDLGNIDVNLLATQFTYEKDSFGDQYDKDAEYKEPSISVATFEQLKAAFAKGGNVELTADIAIEELVTIPAGVDVYLDMKGKTITPASANVDPLFEVKRGASLVIDGDGTFDLGDIGATVGMSLIYPYGDVTINSGTFKISTNGTKYGSMFVGINGGQGKLIINGGYFDGGYYQEGDCFNNCRNLLNGSWGQYIRVYGGTFVGQNPAWGDEGMAFLCPHCTHTPGQGYCQALFLEGQSREDTELPEGYTITDGTTADGRPTYTVNYSK